MDSRGRELTPPIDGPLHDAYHPRGRNSAQPESYNRHLAGSEEAEDGKDGSQKGEGHNGQ